MTSLAALPSSAGYGAGDIVNVKGVLYVLVDADGNNQFHGTAGLDSAGHYLGTIKVDGASAVGSFVDPAVRGEVTWVYSTLAGVPAQTGVPLARLRILRAAFECAPPAKLHVRVVDQRGQTIEVVLSRDRARDTGSGQGSTATGVYAWKSAATGETLQTQAGERFTASVYGDDSFSTGVEVHVTPVWERWLPEQLQRASVDASTIDADTAQKQQAIRDAIDAESKLVAGAGIRIGSPNAAGKRTIAAASRRELADDAFRQPPLDQSKPWRVPAIERDAPVIVKLTYDPSSSPPIYESEVFDIGDTVEAAIEYTRLADTAGDDRGKFVITTEPLDTSRTLANLFPNGTVTHFTIRIGENAERAESGRLIRLPVVKDPSITNSLALRTTIPVVPKAEELLASANEVWAKVNFVVAGGNWRRDAASDLTAAAIRGSSLGSGVDIGDLTSDGTSIYVLDRSTFDVVAFTDGVEDASKNLDGAAIKTLLGGTRAVGLTTDDTSIYVLSDSGYFTVCTAGRCAGKFGTVTGTSALSYDGEYLLIGSNQGTNFWPAVRPYTTAGARVPGRTSPNNLRRLGEVNSGFRIAALAHGHGVVYVGDSASGRVYAFVAGIHDASRESPAGVLEHYDVRGLAVHDGKLYVAAGTGKGAGAASAFIIPQDTYGFPEGYHFTVLDQAALRKAARGLTRIHDGAASFGGIRSTTAAQRTFTLFTPSFDLDLVEDGALWSELELTITAARGTNTPVGFVRNAARNYREGGMTTIGALTREAAYTSGAAKGVAVAAASIHSGSAELGILRLYLARNSNNELGYLFDYAPSSSSGSGLQLTMHVPWLTLSYLPFIQ